MSPARRPGPPSPTHSRPLALPIAFAALVAGLLLSACSPAAPPPTEPEQPIESATATPAFLLSSPLPVETAPMLATLTTSDLTRPSSVRSRAYRVEPPTGIPVTATGLITLTDASFARPNSALAVYNGWFATFGFPAAAERSALPLGEAAERFDLEWPPLHALIVRDGTRFLLLEADPDLPPDIRAAALDQLAAEALSTPPPAPDTDEAPPATDLPLPSEPTP